MTRKPRTTPGPGLIIALLSLTGMTVSVMQTMVVPLLPHFPQILGSSPQSSTWILTITLMFAAVFTPISGRLGDMIGKKRMLLISLGSMVVGSIVCAVSSSLAPMLIGRALQGVSIGAIALGISLMRDVLPRERLSMGVALLSATMGIGGAIGMPVSALIAQYVSWHALFAAAAVLGLFSIVAIGMLIEESTVRSGGRFDLPGAVLLSAAMVALLLGFSQANVWGWTDSRTLGVLAGSVALTGAFYLVERRAKDPLVDMHLTLQPAVRYTNLASVLIGFAMYSSNLVITQLLQAPADTGFGFGQSMVVAGLCAAPMGLLMMLGSPVAARMIDTRGPRTTLRLGIATVALGFIIAIVLMQAVWHAVLVTLVIGAGVALSFASMPTLVMRAVPPTHTAASNGVNTLSRQIGTSLAAAVQGGLVAIAFAAPQTRFGPFNPFQLAFVLAIVACVIASALAVLIPRRPTPDAVPIRPVDTPRDSGVEITDSEVLAGIQGVEDPATAQRITDTAQRRRLAFARRPRASRASRRPAGRRRG